MDATSFSPSLATPPTPTASLESEHDQQEVNHDQLEVNHDPLEVNHDQLNVLEYNRKLIALFTQFELEEQDALPSEFRNLAQYQSPTTKRRLLSVTSLPTVLQLERVMETETETKEA